MIHTLEPADMTTKIKKSLLSDKLFYSKIHVKHKIKYIDIDKTNHGCLLTNGSNEFSVSVTRFKVHLDQLKKVL